MTEAKPLSEGAYDMTVHSGRGSLNGREVGCRDCKHGEVTSKDDTGAYKMHCNHPKMLELNKGKQISIQQARAPAWNMKHAGYCSEQGRYFEPKE